jgi:hypothetical protein
LQIAVPLKCEDKIALGWSGTTALQFAGGTGQAMKKPTPWVQLATTMHTAAVASAGSLQNEQSPFPTSNPAKGEYAKPTIR